MTKLEPCPFCGNPEPELHAAITDNKGRRWHDKKDHAKWVSRGMKWADVSVYCECGISVKFGCSACGNRNPDDELTAFSEFTIRQYNKRAKFPLKIIAK